MSRKLFAILAAVSACAFAAVSADLTGGEDELFNPVTEWLIDYSTANGIPAGWRYDIPGDLIRFVSTSSGRALQVKNVNPGHGLFIYNDPKIFDRLTGTVLVELTLAFPKRLIDTTAKHQFYFGFAGNGTPATQLVVFLSEREVSGTISGSYPAAPYGKFFRVRMALDTATGTQAVWINGQKLFKADAKPLDDKQSFLRFGDDGNTVSGMFELKTLRITAVK